MFAYGFRTELHLAEVFVKNIDSMIQSKPVNHAIILITLLPIPPKYHFEVHAKPSAVKEEQIHNQKDLGKVFKIVVAILTNFSTM